MEQAKEHLLSIVEENLVHEKAVKIASYEQQLKEECEDKARKYISLASQDVADQVQETAVSVVPLLTTKWRVELLVVKDVTSERLKHLQRWLDYRWYSWSYHYPALTKLDVKC